MSDAPDPRTLIAEFGRKLGIPDVAFDGEGNCRLGFDDVILDITWQKETRELIVESVIGELPSHRDGEFYARLLELNLGAALSAAGSIGIDRGVNRLAYTDHTPLRGMTIESFERFIKVTVDLVEAWRSILASRQFAQPGAGADVSAEFAAMIRV
jgi:hypothetical protein